MHECRRHIVQKGVEDTVIYPFGKGDISGIHIFRHGNAVVMEATVTSRILNADEAHDLCNAYTLAAGEVRRMEADLAQVK